MGHYHLKLSGSTLMFSLLLRISFLDKLSSFMVKLFFRTRIFRNSLKDIYTSHIYKTNISVISSWIIKSHCIYIYKANGACAKAVRKKGAKSHSAER